MNEERSYCGQPVTTCAKIIAWTGAVLSILALIGTAYSDPKISFSIFISFMFYMLTILGLRKEHPTWLLISSIIMLILAVVNAICVILFIVLGIALPESFLQMFKDRSMTEAEARTFARNACFVSAVGSFFTVCFTTFAYNVFSNARKFYLQRGSYISPSILESTP